MTTKPTIDIEAFQAAASTLGLRLEAPQQSWWTNSDFIVLQGMVDGVRAQVQHCIGNVVFLDFQAHIDPPTDLGLSISRRITALNAKGIATGDYTLDETFAINGVEPTRVQTLLTPEFRTTLHAWLEARNHERAEGHGALAKAICLFSVTDENVFINAQAGRNIFFGEKINAEEIVNTIRACAGFAKAVGAARTAVPPSMILAPHIEVWRAFSAAHGLAFSSTPLRIDGVFNGIKFAARALPSTELIKTAGIANAYCVELTLPFARPLPSYLHVAPGLTWNDDGAPKRESGDSVFDNAFGTRACNPEVTTAVLNPEVRYTLLGLLKTYGPTSLTAEGVSVRLRSMVPPDSFAQILEPLTQLEKKLERFFTPPPSAQQVPYRS